MYPPDEHDRFIAHFRGLIGLWIHDRERAVPGGMPADT